MGNSKGIEGGHRKCPSTSKANERRHSRKRKNHKTIPRNVRESHRGMDEIDNSPDVPQISYGNTCIEESDIPGFAYNSLTKRYYKVQPQASGSSIGYRESDLRGYRRHKLFLDARQQCTAKSSISLLPQIMRERELHGNNAFRSLGKFTELSLRGVKNKPNHVQKACTDIENLSCCHYLKVSADGKTFVGCWSVETRADHPSSNSHSARIVHFKVAADPDNLDSEVWSRYGLKIRSSRYLENLIEPDLQEMCIEPVHDSLTCAIYITSHSLFSKREQILTRSVVHVEPLAEFYSVQDPVEFNEPLYNLRWTCQEHAWSVAFNRNRLAVGVGLEQTALLLDISTEQSEHIGSRNQKVLTHIFSSDGNLIYMGLSGDNIICADLRTSKKDTVTEFNDTFGSSWLKLLKLRPDIIVTEDHIGKIKMWDIRVCKPIISIETNKNPYKKSPMFIDKDEQVILSATSDGMTRGWSICTGEKLCEFPSHQPRYAVNKPQIAYATNWGGFTGNAAVLVATGSEFRIHELVL